MFMSGFFIYNKEKMNGRDPITQQLDNILTQFGGSDELINQLREIVTNIKTFEPFLKGIDLGDFEEIWYNSSVDGRKIQGWIARPPGFDINKK